MINEVTNKLISVLEGICEDVYLADTIPETLPDTYITFWNVETIKKTKYNNGYHSVKFRYYVNLYSKNPERLGEMAETLREQETADFYLESLGYDGYVTDINYTARNLIIDIIWR